MLLLHCNAKSLPDKTCNLINLRYLGAYINQNLHYRVDLRMPQVPNIGKLISLQRLQIFRVGKLKEYELRQLRYMNELGGFIHITNLENVAGKDEAVESQLHKKSRLGKLDLIWSTEDDLHGNDSVHLEVLRGLMPPPELKHLSISGYKSATYPSWLLEGSHFENLFSFCLHNCSALHGLPLNAELYKHCLELNLCNVPKLTKLPSLPTGLEILNIGGCPLLVFISSDELEQPDSVKANMRVMDHLASQLVLIWDSDSGSHSIVRRGITAELSSLKQLMPLMNTDILEHLQAIESALDGERNQVSTKENIMKAWVYCHNKRINLLYKNSIGAQLVLPSTLGKLYLGQCNITDGALSVCLGGLTSLKRLSLTDIMTLTTLPSQVVIQDLTALEYLHISNCWCLRSLGGLQAADSLLIVVLKSCPSLELARGAQLLPSSLEELDVYGCMLANDSARECSRSASLPIGHLTSLRSLSLQHLPDLCMLEGLHSLHLHELELVHVPKLHANCISLCRVQKLLCISSCATLTDMLSLEGFTLPGVLHIKGCNEPSVLFARSENLKFVRHLAFYSCAIPCLSTSLKSRFSGLESLVISACPNLSSLPDLPSSIKTITIRGSERLKESCQPSGESWSKIAHIRWKHIE